MRRTPYTARGIRRVPCFRCGQPSNQQWQICADGNVFRGLCVACDIALNELVLNWIGDPDADSKMAAYCERFHMKRQPIPPELTGDELTALATLSPAEIEDAKAMWRQDAPPKGKALLDAPEYEGEDGG